jgi:hypothetical protein
LFGRFSYALGGDELKGQTGELWKELCAQAAVEQDPDKLLALTAEINRLLDEKEERLKALRLRPDNSSADRKGSEIEK